MKKLQSEMNEHDVQTDVAEDDTLNIMYAKFLRFRDATPVFARLREKNVNDSKAGHAQHVA